MKISAILLLGISILSVSSCQYIGGERINGNGKKAIQERSVGNFNGVRVKGSIDVIVAPGANSLKVEADQNLLEYIIADNNGGTVEVYIRQGYRLNPRSGIKVYAAAPSFRRIEVTGSGDIKSQSQITAANDLQVEIKGSGNIQLDVDAPVVEAEIAGSGSIHLNGSTRNFTADIKGSGDVHGFNLLSETTHVDIAGSGNAEVFASKQLNVEIKGAGDVAYKGTASVNQKILGSGNVKQVQ